VTDLTKRLLEIFRKSLLAKSGLGKDKHEIFQKDDLIHLIKLVLDAEKYVSTSPIEQLPLEIAIIQWCGETKKNIKEDDDVELAQKHTAPFVAKKKVSKSPSLPVAEKKPRDRIISTRTLDSEIWQSVLVKVRDKNTSTEALLRAAKPINYDGTTLTLGVFYKFHKEHLESMNHKMLLQEIISEIIGSDVRVVCTLSAPPAKEIIEEAKDQVVLTEADTGSPLTKNKSEDIMNVAKDIFGN